VRESLAPVVAGGPWFDAVVPLRSYHAGPIAMLREARGMAADRRFDLGICIPDSWSSLLLMRAAGVKRIVGYERAGRRALLHEVLEPPVDAGKRLLLARERYALDLVARAGASERGTNLELYTTPEEEARAERVLRENGIDSDLDSQGASGPGFVALAPGASYGSSKQWPTASFARVGDDARAKGLSVVILGAPGEEALGRQVAAAMSGPVTDLCGRLDLGALKAVMRRAQVLVCNDAGARHVAVAFGVPCVVMMGPTSLEKTDCNLERVQVIETEVDCRPCYQRVCPIDHRCMTRLSPEQVSGALERVLATHGDRTGNAGP
jgi:heptosyltransferase-2